MKKLLKRQNFKNYALIIHNLLDSACVMIYEKCELCKQVVRSHNSGGNAFIYTLPFSGNNIVLMRVNFIV